ncbi:MAG: hypothetical protein KDA28_07045 [Phycisphaerales bacterium]|nr:hypothetical protein [Phycisphaerales bacterium]
MTSAPGDRDAIRPERRPHNWREVPIVKTTNTLGRSLCLITLPMAVSAAGAEVYIHAHAGPDDSTWTMRGNGRSFGDAQDQIDPMNLVLGTGNGNEVSFDAEFDANFLIVHQNSIDLGGVWLHIYSVSGEFGWLDDASDPIITGSIDGGVFTATGSEMMWGTTATFQASDFTGSVTYELHEDIPALGLTAGILDDNADASFALSSINSHGDIDLPADGIGNVPYPEEWFAKASFTGSVVPAPAGLLVLATGGLLASRSRRR